MKKIAINGRFLTQAVTGVQRVGIEVCRALDDLVGEGALNGLTFEIIVPARSVLVTDLHLRHIPIRRFGVGRGHLWEQLQLPLAVGEATLLALGNTAPVASLLLRPSRTMVMVHDLSYHYFPEAYSRGFRALYELITPLILRRAARVFTVSESEKQAISHTYPDISLDDRLVAVQNGASLGASTVDPLLRDGRGRQCLYVGSLTRRKNAEGLVAAAVSLVRDHDATFVIAGASNLIFDQVKFAIPAAVADRIIFLGQLDDPADIAHLYATSAVLLFPSFYEASPLPPIEAMSLGCPVVAADIPSLRERCGDAAAFVDPKNVESIVKSAADILNDGELWDRLSVGGRRWSRGFSWRRQALALTTGLRDCPSL